MKINSSCPPNIILISVDALRPDHLGCYGYKRNTSPHIDSLAQNGTIFTQAISSATFTTASLISILASHVFKYNMLDIVSCMNEVSKKTLSEVATLPEALKEKGYSAAFFGPGVASSIRCFDRFDLYDKCPSHLSKTFFFHLKYFLKKLGLKHKLLNKLDLDIYQIVLNILRKYGNESADVLTSKAMRWISGNKNRPFFLWLHYFDVHAPYRPPRNFSNIFHNDDIYKTGRHLPILPMEVWNSGGIPDFIVENNITSLDYYIAQYDGAIRFTDEQIGRLLTYFKREGLAENTVFILTADHGEYLGEHDFMSHTGFPLDIVMKVPLIMRYGDLFKEKKVDFQTQSIDIVPTILDIIGIVKPRNMQGISLLTPLQNDRMQDGQYIFLGGEEISVIRGGGYKLIRINREIINKISLDQKRVIRMPWLVDSGTGKIAYLLFDLKKDPQESKNAMDIFPEVGKSLKDKLEYWLENSGNELGKSKSLPLDGGAREYLKSLGYT
ncbi:hypothetical protein EPO66_05550 [bacterium]|nr:MAG: hypothetical protein EPO66_05550 [bacterium]